jgi:diketogulonate reductase-like aldo/keto reductase
MTATTIRAVSLPAGTTVPALGMGTWYLGEAPGRHADQLAGLRTGIEIGLTLVDTAEMYGDGAAEELVGRAVAGRRDDVFLVSKVLPHHATRTGTVQACHGSLRRLGTDHLDMYLLHWRGPVPLAETVEAFEALVDDGLIGCWA